MLIAEVYVEVPVQQINKPFDYLIPVKWQDVVCPGMRVSVPFGPRKLLGFVTKIKTHSELKQLKEIESVLDLDPVLNEELLQLGKWMAAETVCLTIAAYQAMLPAALKGKYQKTVIVAPGKQIQDCSADVQALFGDKTRLNYEEVLASEAVKEIQTEISNGHLELVRHVGSKGSVRTEKVLRILKSHAELETILQETKKGATKQRELLEFLCAGPTEISFNALKAEIAATLNTVKILADRGIVELVEVEQYRDPFSAKSFNQSKHMQLTPLQARVFKQIETAALAERNETFLLYGVTGSGKTEVYLQSIDVVRQEGKQAIMLVPEISLTPQMVTRFKGRFGDDVAVLHSGLSKGEKYDEWRRIHRGEVSVVVGARSAIFAPFKQIGIIIIDEEHEGTYKQEDTPRYHTRNVAIKRAEHHRCPVVMGSATPSLESFARAKKSVYTLLTLGERINQRALPTVSVVDMREELRNGNRSMFSTELAVKIEERLVRKEQIVLLLNRRGYSSFVMCRDCGIVVECPNCDVSLTYHSAGQNLKCHYCGFESTVPTTCPSCQSDHIRFFGTGTQKVEEEMSKRFPNARVVRMDVDTTRKKGAHEKLLQQVESGQADILLGTQMIAKGLDFPNITLVGVLSADTSLHIADFRASEKTFQLLTQVSGRAGRHELEGEVVIQTYTPEHYSIELAALQNYDLFYEREMTVRRQTAFSPYYFMTLMTVSHVDRMTAMDAIHSVAQRVKATLGETSFLFGPTPSPIAKVNNRYRFQCLIKYRQEPNLLTVLSEINEDFGLNSAKTGVFLSIDMNPNMMM